MKRLITLLVALPMLFSACGKGPEPFIIPETDKTEEPEKDTEEPLLPADPPAGTVIVGYAVSWESRLPDPKLLTHINYAFSLIKNDFETLDIQNAGRLSQIAGLKKTKPGLKVLLSIGGWGAGNFSEMAASEKHRKAFCQNCLAAVKKYGLDGIDIDWEFPTSSSAGISSSPDDTKNFTLLMRDLRQALGKDRLLTMASSAGAGYVVFKDIVQYLNFVNIMTYDMASPPGHNSPLYHSANSWISCDESVSAHHAAGVSYDKIVMGIPFYGHGDGKAYAGYVDFKDIPALNESLYTVQWDEAAQVPYIADASGRMVFSYDDARSVGLKADYILQKKLAGAMYWNIEADDASFTLGKTVASRLNVADFKP